MQWKFSRGGANQEGQMKQEQTRNNYKKAAEKKTRGGKDGCWRRVDEEVECEICG